MFGLLVGTVVLLSPPLTALAANRCEQVVLDDAKQLSSRDVEELEDSAKELKAKGADVHIITLNIPAGLSIDEALLKVVRSCRDWLSTSSEGHPVYDSDFSLNDDAIVLAAAPSQHATNLRFGSKWATALEKTWRSIEIEDMNPLFRRRDLVGGLEAGERRIAQEIDRAEARAQAEAEERRAPSTPTGAHSSQAPTGPLSNAVDDLTQNVFALMQWTFPLMFLSLLVMGLSKVFGGYSYGGSSSRSSSDSSSSSDSKKETIIDLEQALAREQKAASECIAAARKRFAEYEALGGARVAEAKAFIDQATERYANAAGLDGVSTDTSRQEIRKRADEFSTIAKLARNAEEVMDGTYSEIGSRWKAEYTAGTAKQYSPAVPIQAATPGPIQQGTVAASAHSSSSDGLLTAVVVGSLLSSHHHESASNQSSLDLNRDFLGSDNGGSSSWGSSSSSDSGGSSSWDSSSGGSSDWGSSGSDGGSSSW